MARIADISVTRTLHPSTTANPLALWSNGTPTACSPGPAARLGIEAPTGALALLRDLQDLYELAKLADITWSVLRQAAQGRRDHELLDVVGAAGSVIHTSVRWLRSRIMTAAPQALLVAT